MNLVGKILTVLILVMSLVFATLAVATYATHRNWKLVVDNASASPQHPLGLKQQLQQAQQKQSELQNERDQLNKALDVERQTASKTRAQLETAVSNLRIDVAQLQKEKDTLDKEVATKLADLATAHDDLKRLRDEVNVLRQQIRDAQSDRDAHAREVARATEQMHQLNGEFSRLKALNTTLAADFAKAQQVLRHYGLNKDMDISGTPPAGVSGVVRATPGEGVVEISIGSDQGLQAGHRLEVVRGSTYVGRIEVVRTFPDRAVARILPEFQKAPVMVNDRVESRL